MTKKGAQRKRECLVLYIQGGALDDWISVRSMYDYFLDKGSYHPMGGRVQFTTQMLGRYLHELKIKGVVECKTIHRGRNLWRRIQ